MKKSYFYVGVYEINQDGNVIGSRFSGVITVDEKEDPGPVYAAIIKEWDKTITESTKLKDFDLKIYLEKMELIS